MEKTIDEVVKEYKDYVRRLNLNLASGLQPSGTPVLVTYAGVYRKLPPYTRWISGVLLGWWGDRVVDAIVRVNHSEWNENRIYHHYWIKTFPPVDPTEEIEIKVPSACVHTDHTRVCLLTDYPHHQDFAGNGVSGEFLNKKLCEYNRSLYSGLSHQR